MTSDPSKASSDRKATDIARATVSTAPATPTQFATGTHSAEIDSYRLAAIVESADDAIVSKTLEGIITSWNNGAQSLFGYTSEEVIGQHISILIPEDHLDEEPHIISQLRQGRRIEHYETVRRRKDGSLVDISLTVSPIRAADGSIIGASKIARDISDRKKSEELLKKALDDAREARQRAEEAKQRAEEASRLKDEFLTTISHELRTPLTAVLGWVSLLRSGELDEVTSNSALETIDRNVKAQAQLIEDLLDISRIVSGKMRMEMKPCNLSTAIHAAVQSILPATKAKEISLQVISNPALGAVNGDSDRLQQVIWNLLSNAVKFTPRAGRICIEEQQSEAYVEVTVRDTGNGISPEFLPFIFDRFSQEDSSSKRSYGGLGMGLAIVKYIVELHGGAVHASSDGPGKGAAFTISIPLATESATVQLPKARLSTAIPESREKPPAALNGLKILVVDDEIDACNMIQVAFQRCGSVVKTATSASAALDQIKQWRPDILISDINMPQMDGYELIQEIRQHVAPEEAMLPAVALTAMTRVEDRVKALAAGYQMHVPKPIELSELYSAVASLVPVLPSGSNPLQVTS